MTVKAPFSFQLYSARNFPPLTDTLSTVAGLGYTAVEPYSGLFGDIGALQAGLADNKLSAPTAHVGLGDLTDDFDTMAAKIADLGIETAIVPAVPHDQWVQDTAGWQALGATLAGLADKLAAKNIGFAWHNHAFEFARLADGSFPIEHILGEGLNWQVDIAWAVKGQADPAEWLERYAGRIIAFHIKDIAPEGECADEDGWADVGHGVMDWDSLYKKAVEAGAQVIVAEHDNPSDYLRFAGRSIVTMKTLASKYA